MKRLLQRIYVPGSTFWPQTIVLLVIFFSYLPYLNGPFLGEDRGIHLLESSELTLVTDIPKALAFRHQPSRPVPAILLALCHYFGEANPLWQRVASLLLFLLNAVLIMLVLRAFLTKLKWPLIFAPVIALLYSLHPLNSETFYIATFRWELLALCFFLTTLWWVLLYFNLKNRLYLVLSFFSMGLCFFSKETYTVFLVFSLLCLYFSFKDVLEEQEKNLLITVFSFSVLFWGFLLGYRLTAPSSLPYLSYSGPTAVAFPIHLISSSQALIEYFQKFFLITPLTTLRLLDRTIWTDGLPPWLQALIILSVLPIGLYFLKQKQWWTLWGGLLCLVLGIYLWIPNKNIGSEHYWPLACLSLICLIVAGLYQLLQYFLTSPTKLQVGFLLSVSILAVGLSLSLNSRLSKTQELVGFYLNETLKHPESNSAWKALAQSWAHQTNQTPFYQSFRKRGSYLEASTPHLLVVELIFEGQQSDTHYAPNIISMLPTLNASKEKKSKLLEVLGVLSAKKGQCEESKRYFKKALVALPSHHALKSQQKWINHCHRSLSSTYK